MEQNLCKSCGKPLPINYSEKYCEACKIKRANKTKKALIASAAVVGAALTFVAGAVTKSRISRK